MQAMRLAIKYFEGFGTKAGHDLLCGRGPDSFYEAAAEVFLDGGDSRRADALHAFGLELPTELRVFDPGPDALY